MGKMSSKKITLEEVGMNEDTTPKISIKSLAPGSIINYQVSTPPFQLSIDVFTICQSPHDIISHCVSYPRSRINASEV